MKVKDTLKVFRKLKMKIVEGKRDTLASLYLKEGRFIRSKVPRKKGDLKGKLPHYIRQQLRLNERQFREIKDCTKEYKDYLKILDAKKDLL